MEQLTLLIIILIIYFFEVEMRKKEMRKIAELKDSYLDCRFYYTVCSIE